MYLYLSANDPPAQCMTRPYPMIINGQLAMKKMLRLSKYQDMAGNITVKKAPTTYGGTV